MRAERFFEVLARQGITVTDEQRDRITSGKIQGLLTIGNPKTLKGEKKGYRTAILHLAPASSSGFNTCPNATAGCSAACLNTAGRGGFDPKIPAARKLRTHWFMLRRDEFMSRLHAEISAHVKRCERDGYIPCIRLNGTSDIRWETIPVAGCASIMDAFPNVRFYDYTKLTNRRDLPANYSLTLSAHEGMPDIEVLAAIASGQNVAVVFRSAAAMARSSSVKGQGQFMRRIQLPATWHGATVTDGDESDLRFLDPAGCIVGLRAKGDAVSDTSGFVRDIA
jgi:hypothetical protein